MILNKKKKLINLILQTIHYFSCVIYLNYNSLVLIKVMHTLRFYFSKIDNFNDFLFELKVVVVLLFFIETAI